LYRSFIPGVKCAGRVDQTSSSQCLPVGRWRQRRRPRRISHPQERAAVREGRTNPGQVGSGRRRSPGGDPVHTGSQKRILSQKGPLVIAPIKCRPFGIGSRALSHRYRKPALIFFPASTRACISLPVEGADDPVLTPISVSSPWRVRVSRRSHDICLLKIVRFLLWSNSEKKSG